jgi:hypothetical protein
VEELGGLVLLLFVLEGWERLFPLKGGMGGMTMLMVGLPVADAFPGVAVVDFVVAAGVDAVVVVVVVVVAAGGVEVFDATVDDALAGVALEALEAAAPAPALRTKSGASFVDGAAVRVALGGGLTTDEAAAILRAWVEAASLLAFSRICFCFSSSLARIGTKSSGIGLFNLKLWLNLTSSAIRLSISLLTNACLFRLSLCFSFVTKSRKAGKGSAGGLLVELEGVDEGALEDGGGDCAGADT